MMHLADPRMEEAHRLWDELADFPASECEDALRHLMRRFAEWLKADDVVWVGAARLSRGAAARRDMQLGWRGLAIRHFQMDPTTVRASAVAARTQDTDPGMTTRALVANAGQFRVHRLHDGFVDIEAFKSTSHYRAVYQSAGILDRMFIGFPMNADAESFFLFDRKRVRRRFSDADAQLAAYAMRGLKWFHRELLLSNGLHLANEQLSVTERRIVSLLLTDRTEKEIAAQLGQAPATTHKYITGILRKYGVRGRQGLMALWLGRR